MQKTLPAEFESGEALRVEGVKVLSAIIVAVVRHV
jgi:hypothetical protein